MAINIFSRLLRQFNAMAFNSNSNNNPVITIVCFVLFSMAVNLAVWNLVYDMQPGNQQNVFMDLDAHFSTGNAVLDGIINGMLLLFTVAILSFALLACILHKLQWIVVFFVKASFAILVYTVPAIIISDIYAKFCSEDDYLLALVSTVALYSLFVYKAYNTDQLPNILQRTITVLNCSFASVYYLRLLPRHTIWFILIALILWDLFAVKSKFGPLKLARQNAMDYDASILRYLLFTANGGRSSATTFTDSLTTIADEEDLRTTFTDSLTTIADEEDLRTTFTDSLTTIADEEDLRTTFTDSLTTIADEEDLRTTFTAEEDLSSISFTAEEDLSSISFTAEEDLSSISFTAEEDLSSISFTAEEDLRTTYIDEPPTAISADGSCVNAKEEERKTAYDILHDPNLTSLGLGDFIIYNMLVGKVAMSGSWLALLLTIIGIIIGLIIALQLSSEEEERDSAYFPALPISLILGMTFYGAYLAFNYILIGTILAYFSHQKPILLILGMTFYAAYLAFNYDFSNVQVADMLEGSIVQVADMLEGSIVQVADMLEGSIVQVADMLEGSIIQVANMLEGSI